MHHSSGAWGQTRVCEGEGRAGLLNCAQVLALCLCWLAGGTFHFVLLPGELLEERGWKRLPNFPKAGFGVLLILHP